MSVDSLEDHGIYLRREGTLDSLSDCAVRLQEVFNLILSVQSLEWNLFGGTMAKERSLQPTPVMQYQSELKLEADALTRTCLDPKRNDEIEEGWVNVMKPLVFYRFIREDEEVYKRPRHHHCFICGKHFSLQSRPLLNNQGARSFERQLKSVHGANGDSKNADVCKIHLNISNFDVDKLTFLKYDGEGKKTPDLTVGLLAWTTQEAWHAPPNMNDTEFQNILNHDLVRPFRHDNIKRLEEQGYIKPIFAYPEHKNGTFVNRVTKSLTTFPFILWEAKKATEGSPVAQNSLKVKMILEWQQDLATSTNLSWDPLVFHFTSVGSEWKLYACHIQILGRQKRRTYPFRLLWSGDCANKTKALQLLYLIDIIALWGEFQYKPFAAACIRILKKRSNRSYFRNPLSINLLQFQKPMSSDNFRSLHTPEICANSSANISKHLRRAGTDTSMTEVTMQLAQGLRSLSLEHYYIPEKDGFIWLLHRQLSGADLLVVRVNSTGHLLPAMVIFNSPNWASRDFERVSREERARMPPNVHVDFRYDKNHQSVLQKCFDPINGYCTMSEIQFCAILPLQRKSRMLDENRGQKRFQRLERMLGLQTLINAAEDAMDQWCICQQPEAGSMILCDSTNCATGWHHKECVDLDEDYEAQDWLCSACKTDPMNSIHFSKYDNEEFEEGIGEASDMRIQRARSLGRVWQNHKWPDAREVKDHMDREICCAIEMDTDPQSLYDTVPYLEAMKVRTTTRCRAVLRDNPLRATNIKPRFRAAENSLSP